jgi:hypothetical protein
MLNSWTYSKHSSDMTRSRAVTPRTIRRTCCTAAPSVLQDDVPQIPVWKWDHHIKIVLCNESSSCHKCIRNVCTLNAYRRAGRRLACSWSQATSSNTVGRICGCVASPCAFPFSNRLWSCSFCAKYACTTPSPFIVVVACMYVFLVDDESPP